jgi:CheY-like chemotaxis protein
VSEILEAARRATALTRQLLAFGRKQVLQPRRLDANELIAGVSTMLRRLIGEDIALETRLASGVWPVMADPGQLEQVLVNLAVNARDAMPTGGTLRLGTENVSLDAASARAYPGLRAGAYVSIVVEDTGDGIDPSLIPMLFEPFFTTKGLGEGTGLGLATVYGIVKQSGGHVYAESIVGAGSRFTIFLPRAGQPGECGGGASEPAPPAGSETILLVEAEAAVRAAIRRMLERRGYAVREAGGSDEALGILESPSARVDLVLTDVVMPERNGRALGERIAERWPAMRVMYMSGYTDDEILRRGLARRGASILEKPFTSAQLALAVRRALDRLGA